MKIPTVTIKQLLEAGVHLGHKTFRWNPKMSPYIFGAKNSIHIIDLVQTLELTNAALHQIHKCISSGGRILFVSTKKQAAETVSKLAEDTGQFHVTHRWLGGMLTNWKTISNSIKRYKKLSIDLKKDNTGFTKKENLKMGIQRDKLERSLGGIAEMKKVPEMIFIIDVNIDTNSDPTGINFPIPGNDDARRAINLYCELIKETILDAQKNITSKEVAEESKIKTDDTKEEKKEAKSKDILKSKSKSDETKKKPSQMKKKAKSIISKIKSLASKK